MYYNRQGKKITLKEFAELGKKRGHLRIGSDSIGKYEISTVWLGIDHNYGGGKPIIFETMVFGDDEEVQIRYHTVEEAIAGHKRMVKKYINKTIKRK